MYVTCRLIDRQLQARQSRRGRRPSNGKMSTLRTGPSNCKRTRRVARMAAPPAASDRSLFLSTGDWNPGCLVYGVRLEPSAPPTPAGGSGDTPPAMMELRPSTEPVVHWSEKEHRYNALAAASGGTTILALIAGSRKTVVHDVATGIDTSGPRLQRSKRRPAMLPVGDNGDTVLVMDKEVFPDRCCFEALRRASGDGWRAEALADPPFSFLDASGNFCYPYVSAYFAMGSRVWISVPTKGTFSLDTERGTWREEGTWELPLVGRGLFAPELGVVIGIASIIVFKPTDTLAQCCQVCALDVAEAGRPPVARRVWEIPPEERVDDVAPYGTSGLAHLGNGRFCISRSVVVDGRTAEGWSCKKKGTSFTLVDVSLSPGGGLDLAKHGKSHCHVWPWGHNGNVDFLQPA